MSKFRNGDVYFFKKFRFDWGFNLVRKELVLLIMRILFGFIDRI